MNESSGPVWVVDDDASIRRVLQRALEDDGLEARTFSASTDLRTALDESAAVRPRVVLTDLRMPRGGGLELLGYLRAHCPGLAVIVMTAYTDLDNTVASLKGGAFEFLPKPFDLDEAVALVRRAMSGSASTDSRVDAAGVEKIAAETTAAETTAFETTGPHAGLIGSAPAMQEVFRVIGRLAGSELSVLLTGESGTGKERIARALHDTSGRAAGPFVALNVATLPADLLESELFGHEKGAFSGADAARAGYFEQAAGGTLFLDEIGDMPAALQSRLLRVLAEGDFYRLGGRQVRRADVRLIAATNHDLDRAVSDGRFREDLYHRLNVVELRIPPLRERRGDIPALLAHYLDQAAQELNTGVKTLAAAAQRRLIDQPWPGNVRELVNLCRRLTALVPGPEIRVEDLPLLSDEAGPASAWTDALREWARSGLVDRPGELMPEAIDQLERCLIDEALRFTHGRRADAARLLGIGRNTLSRKRPRSPT